MSNVILGVGEYGASRTPGDIVKTFALGSCVAVILMCPKTRTVGMVHVALPESKINPEKVKTRPGYFADTGIPALMKQMADMGCDPRGRGFIVKNWRVAQKSWTPTTPLTSASVMLSQ